LSSEEDAKSALEEVKKDGADFEKIAKEKTTGTDVKYTVDSAATTLPADVITAAGKLDKDGISDVISVTSTSTFTTSYYIVKVVEKTEKDSDWKTYKDSLETIILAQKTSDTSFQNQVISAALTEANVKIKDDTFANILAQYAVTDTASSDSSASSEASEEETSDSSSETEASEETEESSDSE
jgi:foldase protein PrsA